MDDFLKSFGKDQVAKTPKKKTKERFDPLIYENEPNPEVTIFIPEQVSNAMIRAFERRAESKGLRSFRLVSVINFTNPKIGTGVTKFYRDNHINLQTYIEPGSKILVSSQALYAFTHGNDLQVSDFYDFVTNKTWFYHPEHDCYIFPIDSLGEMVADNYAHYFLRKQVEALRSLDIQEVEQLLDFRKPNLVKLDDPNAFFSEHIGESCRVAWDLETVGLDPWSPQGKIICMTLTMDGQTGYYIPWELIDTDILSAFFRDKHHIGSNLKFDLKWVVTHGVDRESVKIDDDTQHLGHLLNEIRRNGLKPLAWWYTTLGGYDEELDLFQERYPEAKRDYSLIPEPILFNYATLDPIVSWRVLEAQERHLRWVDKNFPMEKDAYWLSESSWSLSRLYREIIVPTLNTFADAELEGIPIDIDKLRILSKEMDAAIKEKRAAVYEAIDADPETLNIDSGKQLGEYIEHDLGWPEITRGKNGVLLTNKAAIGEWTKMGYEPAKLIKEYRELTTLMKTFVGYENKDETPDFLLFEDEGQEEEPAFEDELLESIFGAEREEAVTIGNGMWQYIKPDGRVHANFMVGMADSLRSRCNAPNLQNIPKHSSGFAKKIRELFMPPSDEYVIGESDGAGLQLRLEAILSGDPDMIYVFTNLGGDMHSMTAQEIFRPEMSLEEFMSRKKEHEFSENRHDAKAVNFSIIFNTTAASFAMNSLEQNWSAEKAKEFVKKWGLEDVVKDKKRKAAKMFPHRSKEYQDTFAHYWASAVRIIEVFFEKYKGVRAHIDRSKDFAAMHGYIRNPFGGFRRVPELLYLEGRDVRPAHLKNLFNITTNSPIQTMEAVVIYYTMNETRRKLRENGLRSKHVGMVHDSIVTFKHRDEIERVSRWERQAFEEPWPEKNGVPLLLEVEIADPKKDQYWGFGEEIDVPMKVTRKRKRTRKVKRTRKTKKEVE